jgi:PAS domain S-box-containing protein
MALNHVHPDDLALLRKALKRAANETEDVDLVYRLRMPEGSIKHVQVVARSVADETGKPMYVGAVMDITARKKTQDALRYSESRYHNLFRAMAASFWELDVSEVREMLRNLRDSGVTDFEAYFDANPGFLREMIRRSRVIDVNDQTVAMFGGSKEELQVNVERIWPEESNPYYAEAILHSIMGKPDYSCECKLSRLDGTRFDAQFTAAFPPKSFRMGPLILGIIDITARKKAEKMLEHVQAEFAHAARISVLGELTASIAHEVNQPLAAITANGEAGLRRLGQSEPGIEKARDLMTRMVADARRAAEIISRVRAMAARREPEQARLSLYQVIDEVLMFLGHEIQSCGVTVALDRDPVPEVLVDRTQLQQVFVNLAVNAMQAMVRSGGSRRVLTIRTRRSEEGTASCIVEDSGPGIKPEHLDRLFESFFTTKDGGMGMGLPICRSIIEAHGGCIRVDNDSAHGGARFTFTLPAADVVH